jgi:hypothetical protein
LFTSISVFNAGGPKTTDIVQGNIGDCWLLAGLGGIANQDPNVIRRNVVDFDDGTYGVALGGSFYRVDNELPVWNVSSGATSSNLQYAQLGAQNSMWVAIVEKAFTYYRSGLNTYASIDTGWSREAFAAFGLKNISTKQLSTYTSAATMASDLYTKWTQGYSLAVGSIVMDTGGNHEFTITSFVRNAAGTVTDLVIRNPWGTDSLNRFSAFSSAVGGTNANDGYFTVTVSDFYNSGGWVYWGQV